MATVVKKAKYGCAKCSKSFNRGERLEHHIEIGCNRTICNTCKKNFRDIRSLERHQKKSTPIVCDHCDVTFCNTNDYEKHQRSIPTPLSHDPGYSLDTPVCPKTGYEDTEGYKEQIEEHCDEIRDKVQRRDGLYMKINKALTPEFTYRDLRKILYDIYANEKSVYKTNMGFGFMLYHTIEKEFKYFYVSSNSLLFDRAFQVSKKNDVSKLFQHIVELDLINNYYLKKPSSS